MKHKTDSDLIDSVLNNNSERAFAELVDRYQRMVINTCRGFVASYADAEDIAQEVFLEMHESLAQFKGQAKLSTWLYRIAVNKSLNHLRRAKRSGLVRSIESFFGVGEEEAEPLEVADQSAIRPDDGIQRTEQKRQIREAIANLPENQRIAFILNKYQSLSYKEVAEVMGVSLSAVESLLFRAKANLQKELIKLIE